MVFFMIIPLIFGAFGNFLLPTQLGVHDVAFPRLNSAAFWFLPGGLIMLCQLVCIDRRYQRMNCFNIRELQGILKRKFFTDLVNTNDFRSMLEDSSVGLRFKNYDTASTIESNTSLFYAFGTTTTAQNKSIFFESMYSPSVNNRPLTNVNSAAYLCMDWFSNSTNITNFFYNLVATVYDLVAALPHMSFNALKSLQNAPVLFWDVLTTNISVGSTISNNTDNVTTATDKESTTQFFSSENVTDSFNHATQHTEASSFRFTRFANALINYDYKCGHYLGI
jgi:hypothetical protein